MLVVAWPIFFHIYVVFCFVLVWTLLLLLRGIPYVHEKTISRRKNIYFVFAHGNDYGGANHNTDVSRSILSRFIEVQVNWHEPFQIYGVWKYDMKMYVFLSHICVKQFKNCLKAKAYISVYNHGVHFHLSLCLLATTWYKDIVEFLMGKASWDWFERISNALMHR